MAEPPVETIPIPDFRTVRDEVIPRPSPDQLDTIYVCQQRQEWYRRFVRLEREPALPFVGSLTIEQSVDETARRIATDLQAGLAA